MIRPDRCARYPCAVWTCAPFPLAPAHHTMALGEALSRDSSTVASNSTLERTAGAHALATAAQRKR